VFAAIVLVVSLTETFSQIGMDLLSAGGASAQMAIHDANNMPMGVTTGNVMVDSRSFLAQFNVDNAAWLTME
jgi:hypothetical protein